MKKHVGFSITHIVAAIVLMCMCIFSLMIASSAAFAQDRAQVQVSNYDELAAAVQNAKNVPTTIQITADFETTGTNWAIKVLNNQDIVVTDDGSPHTILLNSIRGTLFEVTGENAKLTIDSSTGSDSLTFIAGQSITNIQRTYGTIFMGSEGSSITLKHGKLTNQGSQDYEMAGLVSVASGSTFTLDGGVIGDCTIGSATNTNPEIKSNYCASALYTYNGGHIVMNGGEIRNISIQNSHPDGNTLTRQAPIIIYSDDYTNPSSFTMNGGSIHDNHVDGSVSAGAILQLYFGDVTINSGEIHNNVVTNSPGGAITIAGYVDQNGNTPEVGANLQSFTMTGGKIYENESRAGDAKNGQGGFGGAMYLNTNKVSLTGGEIYNNIADGQGGGIYISKPPIKNTFNNVLVYDNHASVMGGGMWYCPTGTGNLSSLGGIAIYNNASDGAGDDVALLGSQEGNKMTVESRLLGTGLAHWVEDGKVERIPGVAENINLGRVADDSTRYDAANPQYVEAASLKETSESLALKSLASDATIAAAKAQGKVKIYGNRASRGGGIATNASVNGGTPSAKDWKVVVKAVWDDTTPKDKRIDFVAHLKNKNLAPQAGEAADTNLEVVSTLDLQAANQFSAEYKDFVPDDMHYYTAEALLDSDNYEVSVDPVENDEEARTSTVVLHIKYVEPKEPETPVTPTEPTTPKEPKGETPKTEAKAPVTKHALPKTADLGIAGPVLTMLAVAGVSLLLVRKKLNG